MEAVRQCRMRSPVRSRNPVLCWGFRARLWMSRERQLGAGRGESCCCTMVSTMLQASCSTGAAKAASRTSRAASAPCRAARALVRCANLLARSRSKTAVPGCKRWCLQSMALGAADACDHIQALCSLIGRLFLGAGADRPRGWRALCARRAHLAERPCAGIIDVPLHRRMPALPTPASLFAL